MTVGAATVTLVAAVARGGVIGRGGTVPWHLPEDMAFFRDLTTGSPGRDGTADVGLASRPLPPAARPSQHRRHPESRPGRAKGAERAGSLDEALRLAGPDGRVFVIGGAEIYRAALPHADELVLTEVELDVAGDTYFPKWERDEFVEVDTGGARRRRRDADRVRHLPPTTGVSVLVGTSGWGYPSWQPGFYPAGLDRSEFLSYYASRLPTVELNATKYRLPRRSSFARGRRRSRADSDSRSRPRIGSNGGSTPSRPAFARSATGSVASGSSSNGRATRGSSSCCSAPSIRRSATRSTSATHRGTASKNSSPKPARSAWTTAPGRAGWAYLRYRELVYTAEEQVRFAAELRALAAAGTDTYAFFRHGDEPDAPEAALAVQGPAD